MNLTILMVYFFHRLLISHFESHNNWIICENYTPIGVVVVVDVQPTQVSTKVVVEIIEDTMFLLFIIIFQK